MTLPSSKTLLSVSTVLFACFTGACAGSPRPEAVSATAIRCDADTQSYLALAGCEEVVGDLHVENVGAKDLTELGSLRVIEGTLFISGNTELRSLHGLERLHSANEVVIVNNPNLGDVSALNDLERVERISIAHNGRLRVISGMDRIEHLQTLMIMHNGVTHVSGFDGLVSAGDVTVAENERLIYMTGMKQLSFVVNLGLEQNPRLAPTPGMFSNLKHVAEDLSVSGCPGVSERDVFPSRTPIETASR
jgi:hypothetical protein